MIFIYINENYKNFSNIIHHIWRSSKDKWNFIFRTNFVYGIMFRTLHSHEAYFKEKIKLICREEAIRTDGIIFYY